MRDLGFIDDDINFRFGSNFFPSKVGGKPAWLDLKYIPDATILCCQICGKPRVFLCQLYCPIDEVSETFHRTIFIFFCVTESCFSKNSNQNFIVLRSQLSRNNNYYSYYPPEDSDEWNLETTCKKYDVYLCEVCGIKYKFICEKCGKPFCTDFHKYLRCRCDDNFVDNEITFTNILPEYGLAIEPDDCSDDETSDEDSDSETDLNVSRDIGDGTINDTCDNYIEKYFSDCVVEDRYFKKFRIEVLKDPQQVIRHSRETEPLWVCEKNIPLQDQIPSCPYCGAQRSLEFQVLPQMLNYLKLDTEKNHQPGILDWGTLVIYTCKKSCDNGPAYKEEYLWKQDIV